MVLQKYIQNPLLIDGYKFDMRIYVLVTSVKPIEAFIFKEGFARSSTEKFSMSQQNLSNKLIHLTNFAIQKKHYDHQKMDNFIGGTKISLKMLKDKLQQQNINWQDIWKQVKAICVKSNLACQQDMTHLPNCFEIHGYDIIIDNNLKCWLLEINSTPSLGRDFIIDDLIKQQLVDDTIDLIKPIQFDRQRLVEVLERRCKESQGFKNSINTQSNSKLQTNRDLNYILGKQKIRRVGEMPENMGDFEILAPTEYSEKLVKFLQRYKTSNVKNSVNNNEIERLKTNESNKECE